VQKGDDQMGRANTIRYVFCPEDARKAIRDRRNIEQSKHSCRTAVTRYLRIHDWWREEEG